MPFRDTPLEANLEGMQVLLRSVRPREGNYRGLGQVATTCHRCMPIPRQLCQPGTFGAYLLNLYSGEE